MRLKFFLVAVLGYLLVWPGIVSAHFLETDGSIGAVLHIEPEDEPVVGQTTNLFFDFKDKENKFKVEDCQCQVEVLKQGISIYTDRLKASDNNSGSFSYTFPEKNDYQVVVSGSPVNPASFPSFKLNYDINVARQAEQSNQTDSGNNWLKAHTIHLVGGVVILLFLIYALFVQSKKNKQMNNELDN